MSIIVFGATGFTGRLVVRSLSELRQQVVLGGRNQAALAEMSAETGFPYRVADAEQPSSLPGLVQGAKVVISTAGPFARFGEPVVSAAIGARAHFLDTTGEQAYMLRVAERYHGAAAVAQVAVINGQAFEFALGYCAAALLAEAFPKLDTIDVFNRVGGASAGPGGASRGTLKSGLGALAEGAYERRGGMLRTRRPSPLPRKVQFPDAPETEYAVPFPGGEAIHLVRRYPQLKNVSTNLVVPKAAVAPMMAAWSLNSVYRIAYQRGLLKGVERKIDQAAAGPSAATRQNQAFKVLARGSIGGDPNTQKHVMVTGVDPYGITGYIAAVGAKLLLTQEVRATGVVSTDQALGAAEFLAALEPYGVRVTQER